MNTAQKSSDALRLQGSKALKAAGMAHCVHCMQGWQVRLRDPLLTRAIGLPTDEYYTQHHMCNFRGRTSHFLKSGDGPPL